VCCSELKCAAACCSVMQCAAVHPVDLCVRLRGAVLQVLLQCCAVWCRALPYVAVCCSTSCRFTCAVTRSAALQVLVQNVYVYDRQDVLYVCDLAAL